MESSITLELKIMIGCFLMIDQTLNFSVLIVAMGLIKEEMERKPLGNIRKLARSMDLKGLSFLSQFGWI